MNRHRSRQVEVARVTIYWTLVLAASAHVVLAQAASPPGDGVITVSGTNGPEQEQMIDAEPLATVDDVLLVRDGHDGELLLYRGGTAVSAQQLAKEADTDPSLRALLDRVTRGDITLLRTPLPGSKFRRTGERTGTVTTELDDATSWAADVRSVTDGYLASARVIKVTLQSVFVHQEELGTRPGSYGALHFMALAPVGTVLQYDRRGRLLASAVRAIGRERKSPDYFIVSDRGKVSFVTDRGRIEPVALTPAAANGPLRAPPPLAAAQAQTAPDFDAAAFRDAVRRMTPGLLLGQKAVPITRAMVLARANEILATTWTLSKANYAADADNHCSPGIWTRPARLDSDRIGQPVQAPPYQWGGHLTLDGFLTRVRAGARAGDICTCRCTKQPASSCTNADWCLVPEAAGLDCSGFVAAVWNMPYEPTGTIPTVSREKDWRAMQPGDVFDRPGHHVRLFIGRAPGDELGFEVVESSVGCGGVCRQTLRVSRLPGYVPYEYRLIRE